MNEQLLFRSGNAIPCFLLGTSFHLGLFSAVDILRGKGIQGTILPQLLVNASLLLFCKRKKKSMSLVDNSVRLFDSK